MIKKGSNLQHYLSQSQYGYSFKFVPLNSIKKGSNLSAL